MLIGSCLTFGDLKFGDIASKLSGHLDFPDNRNNSMIYIYQSMNDLIEEYHVQQFVPIADRDKIQPFQPRIVIFIRAVWHL